MANVTIINKFGKLQGWNSITLTLLGRDIEGMTELAYDDTITLENAYGAGKYPVGRTEGNYEATASVTLYKEEHDALMRSLPPGIRLQELPPFDIPVQYEGNAGVIQKDIIRNVQFMKRGIEVKQGDGSIGMKMELVVSHIDWNQP